MPQEFRILRCYNCETFQVDIIKKAKKWSCKMCGEKQSVKKIYRIGSAKDCRIDVQALNEKRITMIEQLNSKNVDSVIVDEETEYVTNKEQATISDKKNSKWTEYLNENQNVSDSEDIPDQSSKFTFDSQTRKRNLKTKYELKNIKKKKGSEIQMSIDDYFKSKDSENIQNLQINSIKYDHLKYKNIKNKSTINFSNTYDMPHENQNLINSNEEYVNCVTKNINENHSADNIKLSNKSLLHNNVCDNKINNSLKTNYVNNNKSLDLDTNNKVIKSSNKNKIDLPDIKSKVQENSSLSTTLSSVKMCDKEILKNTKKVAVSKYKINTSSKWANFLDDNDSYDSDNEIKNCHLVENKTNSKKNDIKISVFSNYISSTDNFSLMNKLPENVEYSKNISFLKSIDNMPNNSQNCRLKNMLASSNIELDLDLNIDL